ncbi:MAG: hypothetical protein HOE53_02465 [Candidatus Magasanikbacteria bacterium]|jgi:riboflavin kinase / FMN adenylyltransferase|nr:hypothetical protein [Candidatus Magasanikbacteria bacterium]
MFEGTVIHGDGRGKTLGFPTANIDIPVKKTGVSEGIYAGTARVLGKEYKAACLINWKKNKVEVHLLDIDDIDLYGANMEVTLLMQVSKYEPISSMEELKQKIADDVDRCRTALRK